MIPELSWHVISKACANEKTFAKGVEYFRNKAVVSLTSKKSTGRIEAEVRGSSGNLYRVYVDFDFLNDDSLYTDCNCPAYFRFPGYCKHIVAVLLSLSARLAEQKINSSHEIIEDMLAYFQRDSAGVKEELNLEVKLIFRANSYRPLNPYRAFSLRVGGERLYVVSNVAKLVQAKYENIPLTFSKKFTYDPSLYTFSPRDSRLLDMLTEIYELGLVRGGYYGYGGALSSKEVELTASLFKRMLNLLVGRRVMAEIDQKIYADLPVVKEDMPLTFALTAAEEGDAFLFTLQEGEEAVPLTANGEFMLFNKTIYQVSESQRQSFYPVYKAIMESANSSILIPKEKRERFISEAVPFIEMAGALKIEPQVAEKLERPPLQAAVYLDSEDGSITARLEFRYGGNVVDPFSFAGSAGAEPQRQQGERLLIRDAVGEKRLVSFFAEADFKMKPDKMHLKGEEEILRFVYQTLPELQQHAVIYYSEDFKRFNFRQPPRVSGRVGLNWRMNLLDFNLELEGVDPSELTAVWKSIRERRKYHRLKDGSFLPLESEELRLTARLIDGLEVKTGDLAKGEANLSKAGALFIHQFLQEHQLPAVQQSPEVAEMAQRVQRPAEVAIALPSGLEGVMRGYQETGFKWLKTLNHYGFGGILADDMGLGKTLQAIAFILSEQAEAAEPVLVVAPTSLIYNWEAEVKKFAPTLKTVIISGSRKERGELLQQSAEADILITSYPLLRRDAGEYQQFAFRCCILDEAQYIKNFNTQTARAVKSIRAANFFALTGTPMENSLSELWSVFQFVMPGYLSSYHKFAQKYDTPNRHTASSEESSFERDLADEPLNDLARKVRPFILRRVKEDVLQELPPKIEHTMLSELTREQKKIYLAYLNALRQDAARDMAAGGLEGSRIKILAGLTRLRQICCHPALFVEDYRGESAKMNQLRELLQEAVSSGHRILLFSQFTSMLQLIKGMLMADGFSYHYLDGSVKTRERLVMVNDFNEGQKEIFLISLKAGGTGLNLTGADMVILYDLWWNPAVEDQAAGRAHRLGQQKVVQVIKLLARDTIEEKIHELQQKKKELIDQVIQPGEALFSSMSEAEIRSLLDL